MDDEQKENAPSAIGDIDTALACLVMLARFHNVAVSPEQWAYEFSESGHCFATPQVLQAIKYLGLIGKRITTLTKRLNESFSRGAENQAFLVETVNGIDTT